MHRRLKPSELDASEEVSLAMAQATMQGAIDASGLDRGTVAMRFFSSRRRRWATDHLDRLFRGECDLTVRDMGRLLAICGFEVRLDLANMHKRDCQGEQDVLAPLSNCPNCHQCPAIRCIHGPHRPTTFEINCLSPYCTFRPSTLDMTEEGARTRWITAVKGMNLDCKPAWLRKSVKIHPTGNVLDVFIVEMVGRHDRHRPRFFVARRLRSETGLRESVVLSCVSETFRDWKKHGRKA